MNNSNLPPGSGGFGSREPADPSLHDAPATAILLMPCTETKRVDDLLAAAPVGVLDGERFLRAPSLGIENDHTVTVERARNDGEATDPKAYRGYTFRNGRVGAAIDGVRNTVAIRIVQYAFGRATIPVLRVPVVTFFSRIDSTVAALQAVQQAHDRADTLGEPGRFADRALAAGGEWVVQCAIEGAGLQRPPHCVHENLDVAEPHSHAVAADVNSEGCAHIEVDQSKRFRIRERHFERIA